MRDKLWPKRSHERNALLPTMRIFNATDCRYFSQWKIWVFSKRKLRYLDPQKREKSVIYCGKRPKNSVVCGAAWIEFENELWKRSSDAVCSRISAFSMLCENHHEQNLATQHGKERDQQNPKYTAA
jgi:hypothetical protein